MEYNDGMGEELENLPFGYNYMEIDENKGTRRYKQTIKEETITELTNSGNYGYLGNLRKQCVLICKCINPKNTKEAVELLLETTAAESALGKAYDRTIFAGMGVCQFDKDPFEYTKHRSMKHRSKIKKYLNVDIKLIEWEHLRYNPFLSLLMCRLKYLHVPYQIPTNKKGRARYWKVWYNSILGAGTIKHYMLMSNKIKES